MRSAPKFALSAIYNIDIDPGDLAPRCLKLARLAERIPTLWTIKKTQLATLRKADTLLFDWNPDFRHLMKALHESVPEGSCPDSKLSPPAA